MYTIITLTILSLLLVIKEQRKKIKTLHNTTQTLYKQNMSMLSKVPIKNTS